jgi:hypothetical protein
MKLFPSKIRNTTTSPYPLFSTDDECYEQSILLEERTEIHSGAAAAAAAAPLASSSPGSRGGEPFSSNTNPGNSMIRKSLQRFKSSRF